MANENSAELPAKEIERLSVAYLGFEKEQKKLWDKRAEVDRELKQMADALAEIRFKLGAHTQSVNHSEVILVGRTVFLIPVPAMGYSDPSVYPQVHELTQI